MEVEIPNINISEERYVAVKQIENLLNLLEFFSVRKRPATLADVVAHFGWARSSAFNILTTLVELASTFS